MQAITLQAITDVGIRHLKLDLGFQMDLANETFGLSEPIICHFQYNVH